MNQEKLNMHRKNYIILPFIFLISCQTQFDWDNPLDPAGNNYQPPETNNRVLIIDFEKDINKSLWGWAHYDTTINNGQLIKDIIQDSNDINRNHVLKLVYDVTNVSSQAIWIQPLGSTTEGDTIGSFNPVVVDLKYFTFYAKGEKGGEKFWVTITDINEHNTDPAPDRLPLTTKWVKYRIPLFELFTPSIEPKQLISFDITFDYSLSPPNGTIYVDDFAFEW